jgi:hypothetical protein
LSCWHIEEIEMASLGDTVPATTERVRTNTSASANARIREETEHRIRHYAARPAAIDRRLDELDREWDIERTLETNASALAFAGVLLGAFADRRFLLLPALVTGFLFQHAVQGWCPPLPLFRKLGFRTSGEIERERYALKALRGDFDEAASAETPQERAQKAITATAHRLKAPSTPYRTHG